MSVDERYVSAPRGSATIKIARDPKTVTHSAQNGTELAKTASVNVMLVSAPRGSSTKKIALGPQNGEY